MFLPPAPFSYVSLNAEKHIFCAIGLTECCLVPISRDKTCSLTLFSFGSLLCMFWLMTHLDSWALSHCVVSLVYRGLVAQCVIRAQIQSPTFTNVYAALLAIVNTKVLVSKLFHVLLMSWIPERIRNYFRIFVLLATLHFVTSFFILAAFSCGDDHSRVRFSCMLAGSWIEMYYRYYQC